MPHVSLSHSRPIRVFYRTRGAELARECPKIISHPAVDPASCHSRLGSGKPASSRRVQCRFTPSSYSAPRFPAARSNFRQSVPRRYSRERSPQNARFFSFSLLFFVLFFEPTAPFSFHSAFCAPEFKFGKRLRILRDPDRKHSCFRPITHARLQMRNS